MGRFATHICRELKQTQRACSFDLRVHTLMTAPNNASYLAPSTAIILYLAYFSPIFSADRNSGELRQLCSASMLSQRRMTTGPFGRFPTSCVPGPAATYTPP